MGKLYIDKDGVTGIYRKSIVFQGNWDAIKDIRIIILPGKRAGVSCIYFSEKELYLSTKPLKKVIKWINATPFSDDFIYCSVSWPQRVPDILSFIPEENEVHYLNRHFVKNGAELRYSRY